MCHCISTAFSVSDGTFAWWGIKKKKNCPESRFSSVQLGSVTQSCPTLCHPMNRSMPGLPVHHHLPEFTQTHVHRVSDAIQPSHPLSSPSPPAPNPSQHQSLSQGVSSSHDSSNAAFTWFGLILLTLFIDTFFFFPREIGVAYFCKSLLSVTLWQLNGKKWLFLHLFPHLHILGIFPTHLLGSI